MIKRTLLLLALFSPALSQAQLELHHFDKATEPKEDFFRHVNGNWLQTAEIPATEGAWGAFYEIRDRNAEILRTICEDASKTKATKGSDQQLVGDFYASAMDEISINKAGFEPLRAEFNALDNIKNAEDVITTIAKFQRWGLSSPFLFFVQPDQKNSAIYAAGIYQSGLSLPNRSFYLEDNPRFVKIREAYIEHITTMFKLTGLDAEAAMQNAKTVFDIEKRIAQAHRTPVQNRNSEKSYNKLMLADLEQMTFNINWKKYFETRGASQVEYVVAGQPEYIAMLDRMLGDVPAKDWATYLKWKILSNTADYLSDDFVNEDFNFFSKTLRGVQEIQPRWKRMQQTTDGMLGEPLGKLFVAKTFPPEAKTRMIEMIENLRTAFAARINQLDWMSPATKAEAQKKLAAIGYKIGYPDKWRDFSSLDIRRNDLLGNMNRISEFNSDYSLARIGKPVDPNDWGMSPPTVNAYYSSTRNEIVFPAGILQPPFFDFNADDALNYGGIGSVIGHEITHGFDDQGSQFDADGNLKTWWTPEDRSKFEALAQKIVDQYSSYVVLDSVHVNGQLTLGENIADLGGVAMAYDALLLSYKKNGKPAAKDGYTPEQRFFLGFGRIWRVKYRDEVLLERVKTDPHSPGEYRCNGTLSNTPIFHEIFKVPVNSKMKKKEVVKIW